MPPVVCLSKKLLSIFQIGKYSLIGTMRKDYDGEKKMEHGEPRPKLGHGQDQNEVGWCEC